MERNSMKWKTPDAFINATIGRLYDMDRFPKNQPYQCWDYADYFWQNEVGRMFTTKTGSVRDAWIKCRTINQGKQFDLVTDKKKLKKGDWVIFNSGYDGHVGIVKSVVKTGVSVMIQGENQGSIYVNVMNRTLSDFLGAFRYKEWNKTEQKPNTKKKTNTEIAKEVIKGLWGNGEERKKKLEKAGYNYSAVQKIVNKLLKK